MSDTPERQPWDRGGSGYRHIRIKPGKDQVMIHPRLQELAKKMGWVDIYDIFDDDLQLQTIQEALMAIILDPDEKAAEVSRASMILAKIKGLDKSSKVQDDANKIRALRLKLEMNKELEDTYEATFGESDGGQ